MSYDDVFRIGSLGAINKVKMKVIQSMIQVERPTNWNIGNIIKIANEINLTEIYNAKKIGKIDVTESNWDIIPKTHI